MPKYNKNQQEAVEPETVKAFMIEIKLKLKNKIAALQSGFEDKYT